MNAVEITGLCKTYNSKPAVDELNMIIPQGAIYGFIGRNGAGKSTTQKMVCGLAKPTAGDIFLYGKPVSDASVREDLGVLIEEAGLYPNLTAQENMILQGLNKGITDVRFKMADALNLVGLSDTGKKKVKHFSMGMKQRLGIAMAILGDPKLLILDEPINGLDPEGIREFRGIISHLNHGCGMTIFISSHILGELSKIATHYGIIKDGKMVQQISKKELAEFCQDYLCVKVDNPQRAAELLEKSSYTNIEVRGEELRLIGISDSGEIMKLLSAGGFMVKEIYQHEQDLEEYFLDFMGGKDRD